MLPNRIMKSLTEKAGLKIKQFFHYSAKSINKFFGSMYIMKTPEYYQITLNEYNYAEKNKQGIIHAK